MKIDELLLAPNIINFLKSEGYTELYPPQEDAIKAGALDSESVLVSVPTASGKTLIAMLATLSHLSKHKSKVIYLTPLRALASEKFEEFKKLEKISRGGIKVAISTGDFASKGHELDGADVVILTNETMDAMMTFQKSWIYEIGLVVSDEIHLIGDSGRGPTLEMILTRLKTGYVGKKPQIIALSATISNSSELAEWLGCKLVESEWRPVPLSETVYSNHTITNQDRVESEGNLDKKRETRHRNPAIGLGLDIVEDGAQSLIFTMTRSSSVAAATEAGKFVAEQLKKDELEKLVKISKTILPKEVEDQTKLVKKLADAVKNGAAFHHAGLDQRCRTIVETEFKNGNIKLLTATPTLAAGVNLPARRVIISSVFRFGSNGNAPITILEYKQMCGRAGRPQYDNEGESVIVAKGSPNQYLEHYVDGIPESLESQILEDSSLRIHLLGLIATSSTFSAISKEKINEFFSQTFGGLSDDKLESKTSERLKELKTYDMITDESGFKPTKFGQKIFWLRIDPKTAFDITAYLEDYVKGNKHTFGFLHMITNLPEFYPQFGVTEKLEEKMVEIHDNFKHEKLYAEQKLEQDWTKSLLILHHWIDGMTYSDMSQEFNAEPGDIFQIRQNTERLTYVTSEIARFWKNQILVDELDTLRQRIRHGVPEKYIDLVRIKNVGRVRAKILYKYNFHDRADLRKASLEKLAAIDKIGMTIAKSIKLQIEKVR
uniref:ATP-dependent DNA helicase Hel308 n=1 Tax=uncultured marine thaumarchaeote KM3_62_H05 TaxID=1456218 RepID=A0A075HCB5_9ARCH|nr:DEAD/DEAH box helicase domain-containing protein (helS) [uncultured marine thaumarchaeote KM3_62_H05]